MTKLDWDRTGPPRPASASLDHPSRIERPYVRVTDEHRKQRSKELNAEAEARGRGIREAELAAWNAKSAASWAAKFGADAPNPFSDTMSAREKLATMCAAYSGGRSDAASIVLGEPSVDENGQSGRSG